MPGSPAPKEGPTAPSGNGRLSWAALMKRVFDQPIDYTSYH